jgi:hypothetical protein
MAQISTQQIFVNQQKNITHVLLNNIISTATVGPDVIGTQVTGTADAASQIMFLTSGNALAKATIGGLLLFSNAGSITDGIGLVNATTGITTTVLRLKAGSSVALTQEANDVKIDFTGVVDPNNITNRSITNVKIALATLTTAEIAAGTILDSNMAANTITAASIANSTITSAQLASGAISTSNLADGLITTQKIASLAVTAGQIANNTITAGQIATGTISGDRLAGGAAVTNLGFTPLNKASDSTTTSQFTFAKSIGTGPAQYQNCAVLLGDNGSAGARAALGFVTQSQGIGCQLYLDNSVPNTLQVGGALSMFFSTGKNGRILNTVDDLFGARGFSRTGVGSFPPSASEGDVNFQV